MLSIVVHWLLCYLLLMVQAPSISTVCSSNTIHGFPDHNMVRVTTMWLGVPTTFEFFFVVVKKKVALQ